MYLKKLNFYILIVTMEVNDLWMFFKVKRKEKTRYSGFLISPNLYNRGWFDLGCVLETRHVDKDNYTAILQK